MKPNDVKVIEISSEKIEQKINEINHKTETKFSKYQYRSCLGGTCRTSLPRLYFGERCTIETCMEHDIAVLNKKLSKLVRLSMSVTFVQV